MSSYPHPFFNARLPKNIKISTFEKASKSSQLQALILTSDIARFESYLQKSKALDELNKIRSFICCKTISLLRVQRADMCSASDLLTASRAEAECLCIREMCLCIQRGVSLFSFLKIYLRNARDRKKMNTSKLSSVLHLK
jgi:hypothetical protein